jgi:hypothetical protein
MSSPRCDDALAAPSDDALGYRLRGDRCEGRYLQEVASTTLMVAGLSEARISTAAPLPRTLSLAWTAPPGGGDVSLRAQSVKRRTYFRMDTQRTGGAVGYIWPMALASSMDLTLADLGLRALTTIRVGGRDTPVHLPLRLKRAGEAGSVVGYELWVVPGVQLTELNVAVTQIGNDGSVLRMVRDSRPLQYGYYPSQRPIPIGLSLAELGVVGLYRVQLVASMDGGGLATSELLVFHPGAP